jgi:hypothetical protein
MCWCTPNRRTPFCGSINCHPPKASAMASDEKTVEAKIQTLGLNAPRLTPERIDAVIASETFTKLPSGKVMVCELLLTNGFSVRGEASVVSKENFNEEVGRDISRKRAREQIWQLEGYLLQQQLFENS